jgi:allantoinase
LSNENPNATENVGLKAYLSRRVVTPEGIRPAAVLVRNEKNDGVVGMDEIPSGIEVEDFGDSAILPGLVDSHTHINDPGRTDWEGFETATRAAAAGGYTMLVDMPLNCLPATITVAALEAKRKAAQGHCWVDWGAWGGVGGDNQAPVEKADIPGLASAGALGFKCFLIHPGIDGFNMVTEQELRTALPEVARTGLPLLVHAELPGPVEEARQRLKSADWSHYSTYLQSRPVEAELSAIRLLLALCREYGFRLHIVHLSASQAIPELRAARDEGLPVTVETCPHYLHFCAEEISDGATLCKCAPPIRSRDNREQLWRGLKDGVIDLVATDHSPCPPAMKRIEERNFATAWGGIASLSVALPVMWADARRRGFGLSDLARWMSEQPSRLAGCGHRKGRIAPGYDADFLVFDPEVEFVVTEDRLHYRHPVSPYLGEKLRGVVQATYLRGRPVFRDDKFADDPCGREFRH